jgi:peptidyl-prolyl cis-trans isomerase SurA
MMRAVLLILALTLSTLAHGVAAPGRDLDRILVIVNDDVITQSELGSRLPAIKQQLLKQRVRLPADEVLNRQVLERMILERLQLQLAAQLGIQVNEAKVEQAFARLAQQNKLSVEQFKAALKDEGIGVAAFREQLRDQLTIQQLLEREINSRVSVSESEVQAFIAERARRGEAVAYNVGHILIAVPENANTAAVQAAERRARELVRQLRNGADFEQTAVAQSQDAKALEGGGLGWRTPEQLPALFVSALKGMEAGGISDVLRSANGFHILKLNGKRGGDQRQAVVQQHARHILIKPNELVSLDDAEAKARALRDRIEQGTDFAALAKAHSDDPGSVANGGDLGWVTPGQTVPEFERALNELKPGEVSQPVRTPFGVHLIQLLERREADISAERSEMEARAEIRARKADERYEQWLQQLRDEAYVEYRLEK